MPGFKVAIAGCGAMSNAWIKYVLAREDAEIVALVDIKEESAQEAAHKYNIHPGIYTDIGKAIISSGANLVLDVTIPTAHKHIVITSLKLGCDVLGEKPMAPSMEEAREMTIAAQSAKKTYAIMQNRRYLKNIRTFKEIIASGSIGKPAFVCADFFLGPHFGGFRDVMDSPLILDMAIHTFDQARFITGGDPVSVYCHEFNPKGSWYKGNASAICIFEFSNGAVFNYRGSWCAEGCPTSWEASWRIVGNNGTAIWDGTNAPFCEVPIESDEKRFMNSYRRIDPEPIWTGHEGHEGCLDEMFAAIRERRKAETDCTDNIKSMAMVYGAIESARSETKIML